MTPTERDSRRIAIFVNLAKITLLAALAPPVVAGIAQRATLLADGAGGAGLDTAALVAGTVSTGSICAVLGALGLGRLADTGRATVAARWGWVLAGTVIGTAGLAILVLGTSLHALVAGWATAQLGYSGAMAVLRAILASALPTHRRRGAVVVVLGGYGGLLIPLALLVAFPDGIWETTFGLAAASLVVPIVFLAGTRRRIARDSPAERSAPKQAPGRFPGELPGDAAPGAPAPGEPRAAAASRASPRAIPAGPADRPGRPLPGAALFAIQCAANAVIAAFLSYHPLDLAERAAHDAQFPVRASVWVILAAVLGLLAATGALLVRPRLLAESRRVIVAAGVLLALSLVLRAICEPLPLVAFAAALSGAAVGLNNSALLAGALESAPPHRHGRSLGVFSAAGALGQFIGPLAALGVLSIIAIGGSDPDNAPGYRALFLLLAVLPATWAVVAAKWGRREAGPAAGRIEPDARTATAGGAGTTD